jgi:hypothetical protein
VDGNTAPEKFQARSAVVRCAEKLSEIMEPRGSPWDGSSSLVAFFVPFVLYQQTRNCGTRSTTCRPLASLMLRTGRKLTANAHRPGRWRCFASAASTSGDGPLAGIRVLDMTRVLAGVRADSIGGEESMKC